MPRQQRLLRICRARNRHRGALPRGALAVALSLLSACNLFPWHDPASRIYVADAVPQCPTTDTLCAVLSPLAADQQLLAQLGGATIDGRRQLARATGKSWAEPRVRDGALHLDLPTPPKGQPRSVYVVEALRAETAHDTLLTVASNGGTVVWLNGELLGASRSAERAARADQDLYAVTLRQGTNLLLYRVLTYGVESQLHREWYSHTALPDLLAASINLGAYTTLARASLLPDSARNISLSAPQIRIRGGPLLHFRWRTLLGDSLGDGGSYPGLYPETLPLPSGFRGMAVLRTEVRDSAGRRLYFEESPIFADSTARRLARILTTDTTATDPVRAARVDAVRAVFKLDSARSGPDAGDWIRAQALTSLYRHVQQPNAFQRYAGPQVWGYRTSDGTVQAYWLSVPPAAVEPPDAPADPPGLLFSVTHFVHPDFWAGRGRMGGFLIRLGVMGSSYGTFGVMPHLGGVHNFDSVAVTELPAITSQVAANFAIDTGAVGMLAWSSHATEAVQMANDLRVPIAWLGLAVPRMPRDDRELASAIDSLYRIRPRLHWLIWQASQDTVVLQERTEQWVKQVRRKGFDVRYRLVPFSTHLGGYFEDIEADLHRSVAFRFRGAAGRALRDSLTGLASAQRP